MPSLSARALRTTALLFVALALPATVTTGAAYAQGGAGSWLAGDLHVHGCNSHDVFCGPADEPLAYEPGDDPENLGDLGGQAFSTGYTTAQRFSEASARRLDYLAITDHNDVRSFSSDPGFASANVVGIPAYENSIKGHANMLGAARLYANTDDMQEPVRQLRADGGLLQVNHPGYTIGEMMRSCDEPKQRHWKYGFDLRPDTIEVLNPTAAVDSGEAYLECWLQRGERVALTGGGDSHGAALSAAGMGHPTTWVFGQRTKAGVLAALRAGRTAVSSRPPTEGGAPLIIEADSDGDGTFEAMAGDTARPGAKVRVRSQSPSEAGFVRVRANGANIALSDGGRLAPGGSVGFMAPVKAGWVRAVLLSQQPDAADQMSCPGRGENISPCARDKAIVAMTSALYLGPAPAAPDALQTLRFGASSVVFARRQRASTVLRRGGLRLAVRCGSPDGCRLTGDVRLTKERARRLKVPARLGARAVTVRASERKLISLRLSSKAVKRLRRAGGASARVTLRVQPVGGAAVSKRATLTIRPS